MPLIEKEVISPGTYYYTDEKTGDPRKLVVTPEMTKYWLEQGKAMLESGLTVPVPFEHDFNAHPMTPKDKLLNNAGWVQDYVIKDTEDGRKNALFAVTNIEDEKVAAKLPKTIRWTSPWINSFTDGNGKKWNNVISHLALTLRPRITKQQPFGSVAAALSIASDTQLTSPPEGGFFLSRAGRVVQRKSDKRLFPMYPMAFSLFSGVALSDGDMPPPKGKPKPPKAKAPESQGGKPDANPTPDENVEGKGEFEEPDKDKIGGEGSDDIDLPPLGSKQGDVSMEEVLCDLLRALGVDCEHSGDEAQFKRNLYTAAMQKVHELTNKGMNKDEEIKPGAINKGNPPGQQGSNPLIQQEQQPMYMGLDMTATLSLEDIQKISDPTMKTIALSMFNQNAQLLAKLEESNKTTNSLRDAKLKEAGEKRGQRVALLGKMLPKAKPELDAMLALPEMALSMGEAGVVIDPMEKTLSVLEKGIGSLPTLLTTPSSALSVEPHPRDSDELTNEEADKIADDMARRMGAAERKAS